MTQSFGGKKNLLFNLLGVTSRELALQVGSCSDRLRIHRDAF
jgi:hypothetical protein